MNNHRGHDVPEPNVADELEALRKQLETLEANRQSKVSADEQVLGQSSSPDAAEAPPEWIAGWLDADGELDTEGIIDALKNSGLEWLEGFNQDLEGARPSSIVAVFAMGFLLGKLS